MKFPGAVPSLFLAALISFVTLTGCATLPAAPEGRPVQVDASAAPFHDWLSRQPRHRTLQGVAKVKAQTAERAISGTQVILAESPDRLRTETLSPFGTPLLLLVADAADLGVLLPGENLFYRGRATPENLGRFTRLPLRLPELVGILLFRPPVIAYREVTAWLLPTGGWRVELEAGPRRQVLTFDTDRRLTEVRYLFEDALQLRLAYGRFREEQPDLPLRTDLELPLQKIQVSLDYSELVCDRDVKPGVFVLQPPEGAAVVSLDELPAPVDHAGRDGDAIKATETLEGDAGK